jgi:(p)ppGpp synthase/HD superfamily hydrolase
MAESELARAVARVEELFEGRNRNGTDIPYLSHLLEASALTMAAGGDSEQVIAALLHDALEDVPDQISADEIEEEFGPRVREIVEHCTDTVEGLGRGDESWSARKTRYLAELSTAPDDTLVVSLSDKLSNARAIVADARAIGPGFWARFHAPPARQRWYYEGLRLVFTERLAGHHTARVLVRAFSDTVDDLVALAGKAEGGT